MARARYFDGRCSREHEVKLYADGGALVLRGNDVERRVPAGEIEVSERGASGLRQLGLRGGGYCEVTDDPATDALLAALGHKESAVARAQRRWTIVVASIALLVGMVISAHVALPWVSDRVALALPEAAGRRLGEEALSLLEGQLFEPSRIPEERRAALLFHLAGTTGGADVPSHRILFRASSRAGANAFALPNGDIVLTDALVELAAHDDEIAGVVAHELGHLAGRHALRASMQGATVGVVAAIWFSDFSSLGAGVFAFLLQAGYSRDFEREADAFAKHFLEERGISPTRLAAILARMDAHAVSEPGAVTGYLSTHPGAAERIHALQAPRG